MKVSSSIFSSDSKSGFIFRSALFIILLLGSIILIGRVFQHSFQRDYSSSWLEEEEPVDILILGSSQADAAYDADLLSELTGLNTFNLAAKGQQPDSTYYVLMDFLESRSADLIILDVYWRTLDGEVDLSQLIRSYESLVNENVKKEFLREGFTLQNRFEYSLPILRYRQDFHWFLEKSIENFIDRESSGEKSKPSDTADSDRSGIESPEKESESEERTFHVIPEASLVEENKFRYVSAVDFNPVELEYLKKIVELADQKNIPILVIAAPILPESISFVRDYQKIHQTLTDLFDSCGKLYYDYNLLNAEGIIVDRRNFKDENHMNGLGSEVFTERIYQDFFR